MMCGRDNEDSLTSRRRAGRAEKFQWGLLVGEVTNLCQDNSPAAMNNYSVEKSLMSFRAPHVGLGMTKLGAFRTATFLE